LRLGNGDSHCDLGPEFGGTDRTTDPFCYYAASGGYTTRNDGRSDREGYVGINYGIRFGDSPRHGDFYGAFNGDEEGFEIIQGALRCPYFLGNILSSGSEMALTFRLNLPEPCNGDFDDGGIYFWGEAI
jgi:hypothetical protein